MPKFKVIAPMTASWQIGDILLSCGLGGKPYHIMFNKYYTKLTIRVIFAK